MAENSTVRWWNAIQRWMRAGWIVALIGLLAIAFTPPKVAALALTAPVLIVGVGLLYATHRHDRAAAAALNTERAETADARWAQWERDVERARDLEGR